VVSASFNRACSTKQSRRTKRDISAIRAAILDVIEDDPPMTVRQVFYQLVARGVIDASLVARFPGGEARVIRHFTRLPIGLSHRPHGGSVVSSFIA
jgi:hypothetical protein